MFSFTCIILSCGPDQLQRFYGACQNTDDDPLGPWCHVTNCPTSQRAHVVSGMDAVGGCDCCGLDAGVTQQAIADDRTYTPDLVLDSERILTCD